MTTNLHLPIAIVLALASATTLAHDPQRTGALNVPANRIAGLWDTQPSIKLCGSPGPGTPGHTTVLFHAGGTWVENPRFPPSGVQTPDGRIQRSGGFGIWRYNPDTGQYTARMRIDWYLDGVYDGYQTVNRKILLSNNGQLAAGPVRSTRYAADGSVVAEYCGSSAGTRL
jgi:hypothetical protein